MEQTVGVSIAAPPVSPPADEGDTRSAVLRLLLEDGPISASDLGRRLGISAAGVRRHIDALVEEGEAEVAPTPRVGRRGRGRPAKLFRLTANGRVRFGHAYDDLAVAALREIRSLGGEAAVASFAERHVASLLGGVRPVGEDRDITEVIHDVAEAFRAAGYAASAERVGPGVQLCQHHCPVAHVAEEFPALCEAERRAIASILGTHVQRLATIANGNFACTTHVPLDPPVIPAARPLMNPARTTATTEGPLS